MGHKCPPWCHLCPLLIDPDGHRCIMPMCYGSIHRDDLSGCCCPRPKKAKSLPAWFAALEKRVEELEKALADESLKSN